MLGSKTGPLEQNREIVGPQTQQLVELLLGKRVGFLDTRTFDLLGQRKARAQVLRVQLDRPSEMRDSLVQPAACHFQAAPKELDLADVGGELRGAPGRRHRVVKLTEPGLRETQIGPGCGFFRHELGGSSKFLLGIVEQPHVEVSQGAVERPGHVLVGGWVCRERLIPPAADHITDDGGQRDPKNHDQRACGA